MLLITTGSVPTIPSYLIISDVYLVAQVTINDNNTVCHIFFLFYLSPSQILFQLVLREKKHSVTSFSYAGVGVNLSV